MVEGPARVELLSATSPGSTKGNWPPRSTRTPPGSKSSCPQGKVIDLGTEFGVSVSPSGAADVYVFEGRVEAYPSGGRLTAKVDLTRRQGARLAAGGVTVGAPDPGQFVRQIVPAVPTVPRVRGWTFTARSMGRCGT